MRIAFLCGSGMSIPAGMPKTQDITCRVLSGAGVARHTNANYFFGVPLYAHMGWDDQYVPRVCGFLRILQAECDCFFNVGTTDEEKRSWWNLFGEHETNYEDLYYLIAQIHDSEVGEHENPAIQSFIDKIIASEALRDVLEMPLRGPSRQIDFSALTMEARNYIECVVWKMLARLPDKPVSLSLFSELCEDKSVDRIDVYTLNHDTVFEQFCVYNKMHVVDGFSEPDHKVRYWNPTLLDNAEQRMRLFKLHGSVNWIQYRPDGEDFSSRHVGIPLQGDLWHTKNRQGEHQWPIDGCPKMLIGTFNKLMSYTTGIFADLHFRFYRDLPKTEHLVVCGYGFGDKGINTRLLEWIHSSPARRVIVIDPNPQRLQRTARGAIRRSWGEMEESGKLQIVESGIESVGWAHIRRMLGLSA